VETLGEPSASFLPHKLAASTIKTPRGPVEPYKALSQNGYEKRRHSSKQAIKPPTSFALLTEEKATRPRIPLSNRWRTRGSSNAPGKHLGLELVGVGVESFSFWHETRGNTLKAPTQQRTH